uniref:Macro domain-containing protein n=1 Tax=Glossina brevipalpis TaxID=37001 RepID=A0A1A9WAK3_9MUSC
MPEFSIQEVKGDLFSCDESFSIAICIGADLLLSRGIADKLNSKFGNIHKQQEQDAKPGGIFIINLDGRYIYNLIANQGSPCRPSYNLLRNSLYVMRKHMLKYNINKIAIPRFSWGINGLNWPMVQYLLQEIFGKDSITINVYNYIPPK